MTSPPTRVIWIVPPAGSGGIGDYAAQLETALREQDIELHRLVVPPPMSQTGHEVLRTVVQLRRKIELIRAKGPAVVHHEISAGAITALWTLSPSQVPETATIHDAPHLAWWPLYTSRVSSTRPLHHMIHYPLRKAWWRLETARSRGAVFFALTEDGRAVLAANGHPTVRIVHHVPTPAELVRPASERPMAVGLYGHFYRGKGFEHLELLCEVLPDDIEIHVAGRGTDSTTFPDRVRSWGTVDGPAEAQFFGSIRSLLLPYESGGRYGPFLSASGALARALSYETPVVATPVRGFVEEGRRHPAVSLAESDGAADMAREVTALVRDPARLFAAGQSARSLREARSVGATARVMAETWQSLLAA